MRRFEFDKLSSVEDSDSIVSDFRLRLTELQTQFSAVEPRDQANLHNQADKLVKNIEKTLRSRPIAMHPGSTEYYQLVVLATEARELEQKTRLQRAA